MSISKTTDLGKITVSNAVFARSILESLDTEYCRGKVWPATPRGRQIGSGRKINPNEFAREIKAEPSPEGEGPDIEFSVIVRFGAGIGKLTDAICDHLASDIEEKTGRKPRQIKIRIAGVKSKQIVRRDVEVIKRYGTS